MSTALKKIGVFSPYIDKLKLHMEKNIPKDQYELFFIEYNYEDMKELIDKGQLVLTFNFKLCEWVDIV